MNVRRGLAVSGAAAVTASLLAVGPALAAGDGYGPPPPVSSGIASGFRTIVAAKSIPTSGGSLTVKTAGGTVKISVPSGAPKGLQVAVFKGTNAAVTKKLTGSFKHDVVVGAFGVEFQAAGQPAHLKKFVTVSYSSKGIGKKDEIVVYSRSTGKFTALGSPKKAGQVSVKLEAGETIAVVKK